MITRAEYEQNQKHINSNMSKVLSDKWRSKYHIMAPIGWINDPEWTLSVQRSIPCLLSIFTFRS